MNLLFWNVHNRENSYYLSKCIIENNVDIAIIAEHKKIDSLKLIKALDNEYSYYDGIGGCGKLRTVLSNNILTEVFRENERYFIYKIEFADEPYILTGLHLQDRRNASTAQRISTIRRIKNDILNAEKSYKCNKTIIIGDFNANPYDDELLQFDAFQAVLFKDVIKDSETKTVDYVVHRRFYNPIINFLGERNRNFGSYYFTETYNTPVWNCLDQVIVSKRLVDSITDLKYLKQIGDKSLLNRKKPNESISDHLPLLVTLNEGI